MKTTLFGERECVEALKACSEELGCSPRLKEYASWSVEHPERPKAETIRYYLGGWNPALKAAGLPPNRDSVASRVGDAAVGARVAMSG